MEREKRETKPPQTSHIGPRRWWRGTIHGHCCTELPSLSISSANNSNGTLKLVCLTGSWPLLPEIGKTPDDWDEGTPHVCLDDVLLVFSVWYFSFYRALVIQNKSSWEKCWVWSFQVRPVQDMGVTSAGQSAQNAEHKRTGCGEATAAGHKGGSNEWKFDTVPPSCWAGQVGSRQLHYW